MKILSAGEYEESIQTLLSRGENGGKHTDALGCKGNMGNKVYRFLFQELSDTNFVILNFPVFCHILS